MKGRDKSSAFFKQSNSKVESDGDSGGLTGMFKSARASGKLILSGRSLAAVPDEVFTLATTLGEGEKFWETNPLRAIPYGQFFGEFRWILLNFAENWGQNSVKFSKIFWVEKHLENFGRASEFKWSEKNSKTVKIHMNFGEFMSKQRFPSGHNP